MYRVAPMTTGGKDTIYYHQLPYDYFNENSRVILSQVRIIDRRRFTDKVMTIDKVQFQIIQKKLRDLLL